ncbi:MAG: hypothetical protein ABI051_08825 [Vicinamibacterales bacterium]
MSLLSRREAWIWTASLLLVSALLISTHFTSDDPDSALYADLSARLAAGSATRWIAPEWWGNWNTEGLFREHPAGVFLLPALLGALGIPGVQAAYVVGVASGLACLIVLGHLIAHVTTPRDGRLALVLLQVTPLASIFRIRANHEYPMLLCLLIGLVGLDAVRRRWSAIWIAPIALTMALLVKGVFVAVPLLAAAWWIVLNPMQARGSAWRAIAACVLSIVLMATTASLYDALYLRATGETFWGPYWARQLAPLTIATPGDGEGTFLPHLGFYLLRMLWHPAPWSFAVFTWLWIQRGRWVTRWRALGQGERRGALFALGFALASILMLSPVSRFAERYAFSANYAVAAAGLVVALRVWPAVRTAVEHLDQRVPALPAFLWLALMFLRLALGPILPRISA